MAADDPRRTLDLTCDRDDIAALQLLYDAFTHADRVPYPNADDLKRVRRIIRDLDRGYTQAFGATSTSHRRGAHRLEAR
jgi:hypothetical protein